MINKVEVFEDELVYIENEDIRDCCYFTLPSTPRKADNLDEKEFFQNYRKKIKEVIDEISTEVIGYGKEVNSKKESIQNRRLEMSEIMKMLGCTRYKIMKMYAEQDLPLKKEKNKYYIEAIDLIEWVEEQKRLQKQRILYSTIFAIAMIVIMIIMFMILIP